jgi:hypothetical protein
MDSDRSDKKEYKFDVQTVSGGLWFLAKDLFHQEIPFMTALDLLERKDSQFLDSFLEVLKNQVNFKAFYFETPPMTEITVSLLSLELWNLLRLNVLLNKC